jgi:hypothetical protein
VGRLRVALRLIDAEVLSAAWQLLARKFGGIEGLPTTLLYDRQGILRMKVVGFEYTDNIESAIKPLL